MIKKRRYYNKKKKRWESFINGSFGYSIVSSVSVCTSFYKKKVYKKIRLRWPKSEENHKAQLPQLSVFVG